mmetsp:Transcript_18186/g.25175  ORF Transcript_18186/g.25175 Transcript_18186/m.25175 type:complete len:410 (+) Transcript_18186:194-1423(+)|eukprot:CAMPEP_0196579846 /NCGR_PEP_ID=MMETSP1081-20130531/25148_1 /TAXON_ID=36882 /ORGANISM="Pyramimonas amylifera, Strain CCMP720" /LENGTH=409 /DNA_ID=CAMNT_0041899547 /DNA_START=192 /DNA_END=1421 /DNA_ORIENTATION=-
MAYPHASSSLKVQIDDFALKIKRRQIEGSIDIARQTTKLLRQVVSNKKVCSATALLEEVKKVGRKLIQAKPNELVIGNMVRRVLYLIREEEHQGANTKEDFDSFDLQDPKDETLVEAVGRLPSESDGVPGDESATELLARARSLRSLLDHVPQDIFDAFAQGGNPPGASGRVDWRRLKHNVIESINELIDELGGIRSLIAEQALEHIHSSQTVLTFGGSATTFSFFKEATKRRAFSVVVAEAAPGLKGHKMAKDLAALPNMLQITLISDAAIFAMMARVNLVVVGARAVLATGGIIGACGLHALALAAQRHAVPFVVLIGLHKLSPEQPFDPEVSLNDLKSPAEVVDFEALSECMSEDGECGQLQTHNPSYDYVPPHLISLFITDSGGHCPSYVYRLLAEYYNAEDNEL